MEPDPDIFLTISAVDTLAHQAISLPHNSNRYVPADEETPTSSRATTPEPGGSTPVSVESSGQFGGGLPARLQLRFDQPPKDISTGFIFGSDAKQSDVLVGKKAAGISGQHFAIDFDEKSRLVLRNLSKRGTSVSYNGHGRDQRRNRFEWLLLPGWTIKVHVSTPNECVFLLELPDRPENDVEYARRLQSYVSQIHGISSSNGYLYDHQKDLLEAAKAQSSDEPCVYADKDLLGEGGFGTVYKSVNVSTGGWVAIKRFDPDSSKYEDEIKIMRRISHDHIVQCFDSIKGPKPGLVMEYLPLGCLEQHVLSDSERRMLLYQMLSAVSHIHRDGLAHRDIKTANILVKSTDSNFWAKLSDFGFAKPDESLSTLCGSSKFLAPEIWLAARRPKPYTSAVDIWSLGVVMLDVSDNLPLGRRRRPSDNEKRRDAHGGYKYCQLVASKAAELWREDADDQLSLVLSRMLVMDETERLDANGCLQLYLQNATAEDFISPAISKTNTLADFKAVSRSSTDVSRIASECQKQLYEQGLIDPGLNYDELLRPRPLDQTLETCEHSPPSESRKRKRSREPDSPRKFRPQAEGIGTRQQISEFVIKPDFLEQLSAEEAGQSIGATLSQLVDDLDVGFHSEAALPPGPDADGLLPLIPHVQRLGVSRFQTCRHNGWIKVWAYSRIHETFVEIFHLETSEAKSRVELVQTLLYGLQRHSKDQEGPDSGPKRRSRGGNRARDGARGIRTSPRMATRLSTHSFADGEIRQCTVKGKAVHYRPCDRMICLDDLADIARRSTSWKASELSKIPAESKETSPYGTLVAFSMALPIIRRLGLKVLVCRETGMNETRAPAEYCGQVYTYVTVRRKNVCLREADGKVNVAHLVRAAGRKRTARNKALDACGISSEDVEQVPGHPTAQGGYVCYADGRKLCEYLGLEVPEVMREPACLNVDGTTVCCEPEHPPGPQDSPSPSLTPTPPPEPRDPDVTSYKSNDDDDDKPDHSASRISHWEATKSHLSAVQPHYSVDSIGAPGGWLSGESSASFSLFGLSRREDGLDFGQDGG